jgi:hypothetical protein
LLPFAAVAPILDLAVVALAVMVCISMVLLAWTLGVSITGVLRRARASLISARLEMAVAERRLRSSLRSAAEARIEGRGDRALDTGAVPANLGEGDE